MISREQINEAKEYYINNRSNKVEEDTFFHLLRKNYVAREELMTLASTVGFDVPNTHKFVMGRRNWELHKKESWEK
jgi:hypothetical protein